MLRLLTFTTLFPNSEQPNHGIFVENRLRHLVSTGLVESTVLAPVPFFPTTSPRFGRWGAYARIPPHEMRHGLAIHHPRYPAIPCIGMSAAPFLLYQASRRALRRLLGAGHRFDAIDAHYLYPDGVAAVWLGRAFRLPVAVTARGSDVTQLPNYRLPRRLIQQAITRTNALIAVSEGLRQALLQLGARDVTVLRNGVDLVQFHPLERPPARTALGLTRPTLLSVGALIERKRHHLTIAALALLPDFDLLIIGDGPERQRLTILARQFGLQDRVRLPGAVPHHALAQYYAAADISVLASSREGWANVLLESMACGTPVVASNIPGNPEVVRTLPAGRIVAENTAQGIASAVRALHATPPDRKATRAYAEQFDWDETSRGQLEVFRRICG